MKYLLLVCSLVLPRCLLAQAADPNALYLSGKMDTIERRDYFVELINHNLNAGDVDHDGYDDFLIDFTVGHNYAGLRIGGPQLPNASYLAKVVGTPQFRADINGDGIPDLVTSECGWYFGRRKFPFYNDSADGSLRLWKSQSYIFVQLGIDYDEDGYDDILGGAAKLGGADLFLWKGKSNFGENPYPTDSFPSGIMETGSNGSGLVASKFSRHLPPYILFGKSDTAAGKEVYRIGMFSHKTDLAHDSIIWLSNTDSGGIAVRNLYATDITGDGIPDLLVSDFSRVYIFKGGDDFGTYPLTPEHAYYTIPSPRLLDFGNYGFIEHFGHTMTACGDLSGSGIPYLKIDADISQSGSNFAYSFFYAGGKALDSLFDGEIHYENNYLSLDADTLHSIDHSGRSALLIVDDGDFNDSLENLDLLMYRDCDKLPHRSNPNLAVNSTSFGSSATATAFPSVANRYVKIQLDLPSSVAFHTRVSLVVHDVLGRTVIQREASVDTGSNIEYFSVATWPEGQYTVDITSNTLRLRTKFIIQR